MSTRTNIDTITRCRECDEDYTGEPGRERCPICASKQITEIPRICAVCPNWTETPGRADCAVGLVAEECLDAEEARLAEPLRVETSARDVVTAQRGDLTVRYAIRPESEISYQWTGIDPDSDHWISTGHQACEIPGGLYDAEEAWQLIDRWLESQSG